MVTANDKALCHQHSLHMDSNLLWSLSTMNVYNSPLCRLHVCDHGVSVHIRQHCVEWCTKQQKIDEFERRWSFVSSHPSMKTFAGGVSGLSSITAVEDRDIAMSLPFVMLGLGPGSKPFSDCATQYLIVRQWLEETEFSDNQLTELQDEVEKLVKMFGDIHQIVEGTRKHSIIKVHHMLHWPQLIREYGSPTNYNGETWESAHKHFCKKSVSHLGPHPEKNVLRRTAHEAELFGIQRQPHPEAEAAGSGQRRSHYGKVRRLENDDDLIYLDQATKTCLLQMREEHRKKTGWWIGWRTPVHPGGEQRWQTYSKVKDTTEDHWLDAGSIVSVAASTILVPAGQRPGRQTQTAGSSDDRVIGKLLHVLVDEVHQKKLTYVMVRKMGPSRRAQPNALLAKHCNKMCLTGGVFMALATDLYALHAVPDFTHSPQGQNEYDLWINQFFF